MKARFNGKGSKISKEEKNCREDNQNQRKDEDYLALQAVAPELQLVFTNILPSQKADAANYDKQHNCYIYHRILRVTGKGGIEVVSGSQNIEACIAKG